MDGSAKTIITWLLVVYTVFSFHRDVALAEVIVKLTVGSGFQLAAGVISLQVFGEDRHPRGCRALGCFRYAVLEHFSHFVFRYGSKAFRDWFHYTEQAHKQ